MGQPDGTEQEERERRGIFIRLSPGGTSGSALSAGLGAVDSVFNPAAARAREDLDRQHERVVPTPSPGDRMLEEGVIVIAVPPGADPQSTADTGSLPQK